MRCASRCLVAFVALVACARAASAQEASDTLAVAGVADPPLAIWASVGVGTGHVNGSNDGGVAGALRASVSVGPWLLSYREFGLGPLIGSGDGVRDRALLAGMRTGGHRLFASAALGHGTATHYLQRGEQSAALVDPPVDALAYDAALHANFELLGLALNLSGNVGPARVAYSAVTLALELGWFGR
jgi:hypothetical protein